jgi:hypothetical protein
VVGLRELFSQIGPFRPPRGPQGEPVMIFANDSRLRVRLQRAERPRCFAGAHCHARIVSRAARFAGGCGDPAFPAKQERGTICRRIRVVWKLGQNLSQASQGKFTGLIHRRRRRTHFKDAVGRQIDRAVGDQDSAVKMCSKCCHRETFSMLNGRRQYAGAADRFPERRRGTKRVLARAAPPSKLPPCSNCEPT